MKQYDGEKAPGHTPLLTGGGKRFLLARMNIYTVAQN